MQNNLFRRVAVAIVGIPLLLWLNMQGGLWFFALVLALGLMATAEFRRLAVHHAHPVSLLVLLPLTALIQFNFYFRVVADWEAVLIAVIFLQVIELWRTRGSQLLNIGSTLIGLLYVNLCFGALLRLRLGETLGVGSGEQFVLLLLLCVWGADIFAYFGGKGLGGKLFGRKFFARISPKKTWEGYLFGITGSVLAAWACSAFSAGCPDGRALSIGLFIGAVGPLGDLMESMFKRDAGVKDSSALIPGHGGVLDRFDTVMFMAPLLYLFVTYA